MNIVTDVILPAALALAFIMFVTSLILVYIVKKNCLISIDKPT